MLKQRYQQLQKAISIEFKNLELLDTAFVHKSYLNEHQNKRPEHNERLEFLGDAVLELSITEFLFKKFPQQNEGALTAWRAALVQGKHLAEISKELDLGLYLYLSKGEERSGGRTKNYILANVLEALIGAIFLDRGYLKAKAFISKFIWVRLSDILDQGAHIDPKSRFQEIAQELLGITPEYSMVSEEGPDHQKVFTMAAYIEKQKIAEGKGSSKQKAELDAAKNALKVKKWENIQLPSEQV